MSAKVGWEKAGNSWEAMKGNSLRLVMLVSLNLIGGYKVPILPWYWVEYLSLSVFQNKKLKNEVNHG